VAPCSWRATIWDLLLEGDGTASAGRAHSTLSFLAARMSMLATQQFRLHELYRYVPQRSLVFRRFRNAMGWAAGIAGGLIIGTAVAFHNGLGRGQVGIGLANGGIGAVVYGLVTGIGARYGTREAMTVRLPTRVALRRARIWAAVGVIWGLLITFTSGEAIAPRRIVADAAANAVARGATTVISLAFVLGLIGFVFGSSAGTRTARSSSCLATSVRWPAWQPLTWALSAGQLVCGPGPRVRPGSI
jgi:hypothetical protein